MLERSLLLSPLKIDSALAAAGEPDGFHRILYDEQTSYVCSEARELAEVRARDFAQKVRADIGERSTRLDVALREVHSAAERRREIRIRPPKSESRDDAPYALQVPMPGELAPASEHLSADRSRRFSEFRSRADEPNARLAALGFEAWATGCQLIAVTLPR